MYFYLSILILLCILFCLLFHFRKSRILRRVCSMTPEKKLCLLSSLIEPAGFCYWREQDIFSSQKDAWQRRFGYRSLYDRTAPLGQMVFQCEPVYFNYGHKTWLIELWKGQYGINTGAEIGVYHAGAVISPDGYKNARFQAASDEELLSMKLELWKGDRKLFEAESCHWWLTGFRMGLFSWPECLRMDVSITFPCGDGGRLSSVPAGYGIRSLSGQFLPADGILPVCCSPLSPALQKTSPDLRLLPVEKPDLLPPF